MLKMHAQLLRCWLGRAADGGPDPIYPADFEGFLNHPFHDALAVVGKFHRNFLSHFDVKFLELFALQVCWHNVPLQFCCFGVCLSVGLASV